MSQTCLSLSELVPCRVDFSVAVSESYRRYRAQGLTLWVA
jgi:hypothetical protein